MRTLYPIPLALLICGVGPANAAPTDEASRRIVAFEVWTRKSGATGNDEPLNIRRLPLSQFTPKPFDRKDPQYGAKYSFSGFPLQALLDKAAPPADVDLVLLHFANGMAIPLAFRDAALMKRLDPQVVSEIFVRGKAKTLPPVTGRASEFVDIPAIHFSGNKIVVAESWHPALPTQVQGWSPWKHADSLVALEFVAAAPYYAQFDVGSEDTRLGFDLFKQACQFCHGARKVGAKFGWDFVEPVPLYTWRGSAKVLYWHVAFRRTDAPERNEMMPALKYMTEADAGRLWKWLQALGTQPMRPYAPRQRP